MISNIIFEFIDIAKTKMCKNTYKIIIWLVLFFFLFITGILLTRLTIKNNIIYNLKTGQVARQHKLGGITIGYYETSTPLSILKQKVPSLANLPERVFTVNLTTISSKGIEHSYSRIIKLYAKFIFFLDSPLLQEDEKIELCKTSAKLLDTNSLDDLSEYLKTWDILHDERRNELQKFLDAENNLFERNFSETETHHE